MFSTGKRDNSFLFFGNSDVESDSYVMEGILKCFHNASFEVLHLLFDELIINHDFYLWEFRDDGIHVFHASSDTAILLGHTVTHGHPLQF